MRGADQGGCCPFADVHVELTGRVFSLVQRKRVAAASNTKTLQPTAGSRPILSERLQLALVAGDKTSLQPAPREAVAH